MLMYIILIHYFNCHLSASVKLSKILNVYLNKYITRVYLNVLLMRVLVLIFYRYFNSDFVLNSISIAVT